MAKLSFDSRWKWGTLESHRSTKSLCSTVKSAGISTSLNSPVEPRNLVLKIRSETKETDQLSFLCVGDLEKRFREEIRTRDFVLVPPRDFVQSHIQRVKPAMIRGFAYQC